MTLHGYSQILDVCLSTGTYIKKDIVPNFAKEYLGGMGFSCKILYDEVGPEVNPLSAENIVVFAVGPLTGTLAPCSGRFEVSNKSPLTGNIGTGNSGGVWGPYLKKAGYDVLVVRGASENPVYLWINDESIELRDASHLWGKDAKETTSTIISELSSSQPLRISVLAIGSAGENLVKFACTLNDNHHVVGRGGAGAVMGSKKIKAIAVHGSKKIHPAMPQEFHDAVMEARKRLNANVRVTSRQDIPLKFVQHDVRKVYVERGSLPGKNFQTGILPNFLERMSQDAAIPYINGQESTCYSCPMSCFLLAEVKEGKYTGTRVTRGAHPGVALDWGAKCALDNLPQVWKCKELCQNNGLDYASTAGVIAFAMELFQRGIITKQDTNGLDLTWGNEEAVLELINQIILREGFGDVLAEGSVGAAKIIGKDAEKYAMVIKGMEVMSGDPRAHKRGWAFGEITNPRGGDNLKSTHFTADVYNSNWPPQKIDIFEEEKRKIYSLPPEELANSWEGKPMMTKWFEDLFSVCNSLVICIFTVGMRLALGPTYLAKMYSAMTGQETSPQEIMFMGEKIFNLLKAYTVREGFSRKDDCWVDRFYSEPMSKGPAKGAIISRAEIDTLLDEYYDLRNWHKQLGVPTVEKLREVGLEDIAIDLQKRGNIPF